MEKLSTTESHNLEKERYIKNLEEKYGFTITQDPGLESAFRSWFHFDNDIIVMIRIKLDDITGSDLVITNMTVNPTSEVSKGFGSKALQKIIDWAKDEKFKDVRATQVTKENDKFWTKNGFEFIDGENETRDYILKLD